MFGKGVELALEARGPTVKLVGVRALKCSGVLRPGLTLSEVDEVRLAEIDPESGDAVEFLLEVGDDGFDVRPVAVLAKVDPEPALILREDTRQIALHPGNCGECFVDLFAGGDHLGKGVVLRSLHTSGDAAGVDGRHEALGHDRQERGGCDRHRDGGDDHRVRMTQHEVK
jgi:hypothetical protein